MECALPPHSWHPTPHAFYKAVSWGTFLALLTAPAHARPWVSVLGPYSERLLPDVLLLLSSYVLFRQLLSFRLWLLHLQPGSDAQIRLSDVPPREGRRGLKALCTVSGAREGLKG